MYYSFQLGVNCKVKILKIYNSHKYLDFMIVKIGGKFEKCHKKYNLAYFSFSAIDSVFVDFLVK